MRAVIQRVSRARVVVEGDEVARIGKGLLVLAAAGKDDTERDAVYMRDKILGLRIFEDEQGKMNRSVVEVKGELLLVSQFTLYGDVRKGRRPSFTDAMPPEQAEEFFARFVELFSDCGLNVQTGRFRAMMQVELINDGPVTILLDSKKLF